MPTWEVITGDCLDVLPSLGEFDAVISDPPYGMAHNTDSKRFSGGARQEDDGRDDYGDIVGDTEPFDPSPWLGFPRVVLFGVNHFAQRVPVGTTLVWIKRSDDLFGSFLSDAELAWMKGGHGVYCFRKQFPPPSRMAEAGTPGRCVHPTQKPVDLMRWVLRKAKVEPGMRVLDPYCGTGTTGVACAKEGIDFVGVEIRPDYADIARRRISDAEASLFAGAEA